MMLSERMTSGEFEEISSAFLAALLIALPSYFARLEAELVREGEVDVDWLGELQPRVEAGLAELLGRPAEAQQEPPVGLIRRLVIEALSDNGCDQCMQRLQRRGLLPASAVDIDADLGPVHLAWGVAKARRMRIVTQGSSSEDQGAS
jgi:hypothetical protein